MIAIDTIVVPRGAEYQAVRRALSQSKVTDIQIISIPIGTKNTRQTLISYAEQVDNSQQVLILGLCGSLDDSYGVGDKVLVKSCQDLTHNRIELDRQLTASIQDKLSLDLVSGLTSDRIIARVQEKQQLSQQYPAEIVEMEGYSYVKELQRLGKSVAMLRVVSDDLTGNIPELDQIVDSQGSIKVFSMAIAFIKQPIAALQLIKGSLTGLKALKQVTAKLFS